MTELNELFEQIFHAELKFKARTDKLKQLAQSIEAGKAQVLQTKEECRTKEGELAVKNNKLADLQVEVKLLTLRKGILQEQNDSLVKTKEQLVENLADVKKRCEEENRAFKKELTEFGCSYDLHGAGFKQRQEETKRKIELLQDELLLLRTELAEMDVQKEEVQKVESELLKAKESLELEIAKTEEFKRSLSEQEAEIKKLEEECSNVNQRLSKDPDFVRLQRELEFCKACPEEAECDAASRQLSELQQKCYYHQMKRQLDRQKNSIQNKSLDSERRPGHYNPYTCQYVPAPPKSSANNSFNEGCWNNAVLRPNSNNSGFRRQSNKHKEEFPEEEDVKLVDDEWLMIGEVEHLDDDGEWDVESLQDEIEDDNTIMDEDWDDFDAPPNASATRKHHQFSSHDSNDVKNLLTTSHAQSASTVATKTTKSKCLSSQSQTMPPVTKAIDVTMSQPKHKLQRNVILSEETPSRPIRVAPPRSSTMAHWNKVSRKPMNRSSNEAIIPSDVLIVDSPDPNCVLRKRSGQSIYKAPGSKPNCDSLPKKAKKVRFHH